MKYYFPIPSSCISGLFQITKEAFPELASSSSLFVLNITAHLSVLYTPLTFRSLNPGHRLECARISFRLKSRPLISSTSRLAPA